MALKPIYYTFNKNLEKVLMETPLQKREKYVLSNSEIYKLHSIGKKVEKDFGTPQDVEWALKGDKFYLLQTRPLTV